MAPDKGSSNISFKVLHSCTAPTLLLRKDWAMVFKLLIFLRFPLLEKPISEKPELNFNFLMCNKNSFFSQYPLFFFRDRQHFRSFQGGTFQEGILLLGPYQVFPEACLEADCSFKISHLKIKSVSSCCDSPFFHSKAQDLTSLFYPRRRADRAEDPRSLEP